MVSPEGIAWREYRGFSLLCALPLGILWEFFYFFLRLTRGRSQVTGLEAVPANAILIAFHPDFPIFPYEPHSWREVSRRARGGTAYLGSHHILSYVPSFFLGVFFGFRCVRYDRRSGVKPFDQTLLYLQNNPETVFALRTDSGGPYYQVRPSVLEFSRLTGRPIAGFRQSVSRFVVINHHKFPLPFARVHTVFGKPISASALQEMGREAALATLKSEMDRLGETASRF